MSKLLTLGEQLKPLLAEIHRMKPEHHRLWQEASDDSGPPPKSLAEIHDKSARFKKAAKKNGYSKLCQQLEPVCSKADRIAKRILEIEPTDRIGDGIHAAAALFLNEPDGRAGEVLRRMATNAGFHLD